jgi:hypothetical protein
VTPAPDLAERTAYALTHPITDPDPTTFDVRPYQVLDTRPDGNLLLTMLAVDR